MQSIRLMWTHQTGDRREERGDIGQKSGDRGQETGDRTPGQDTGDRERQLGLGLNNVDTLGCVLCVHICVFGASNPSQTTVHDAAVRVFLLS